MNLSDLPMTIVLLVSIVLLTASLTAAIVLGLSRRRQKDAHEVVTLLEQMRSGRVCTRLDLDARSPFASIAESANRLGQDLGVKLSRAENANEAFDALQDAARGYAVIATDADGDVRGFSSGAGQLFGWEEDAIVGRNTSLLFDSVSWKELLPKLARRSVRERGVETRAAMQRHDGTRFDARVVIRVLRGSGDESAGFLLVVEDVSRQVKLEAAVRAAESLSQGILEGLPAGVALVEGGKFVYANPTLRSLLELQEGDGTGMALLVRIATSHVLLVQDALAKLEAGGEGAALNAIVTTRDAAGRASREVRFVGVAHAHERRPATLIMLRDETAGRRLLRTLAAHEERLSAVLDAWDDAVLLVEEDASGVRVRLANRAFVSLFSLAPGDVAGVAEADVLRVLLARGDEGTAAASCLAASARGPANETVTTESRTLLLWAAPLTDPSGSLRLRMLTVRDVTAEAAAKRTQGEEAEQWRQRHETVVASYASLAALHDEVAARRDEAERLNAELRTLDTMKSDLLANVSHELQTPLVSVRGYTEMILKERLGTINDEQKKGLSLSLKNIDRLIAMIDNLLAFARVDRDSGEMKLSTFPIATVIDEALAVLREKIEAKSLRVTRNVDDPGLTVNADRDKILQVFLNLIGNAVKFSRERGSIEVVASKGKPGFALVQVCDTGVGIAKADLERIFDRFYQAGQPAAGRKEGTGIGLAIVRNILQLHGCTVQATSELGEGTVITFTLPLADDRTQAQPGPTPAPTPTSTPSPNPAANPAPTAGALEDPPVTPAPDAPVKPGPAERPRLRIIRRG